MNKVKRVKYGRTRHLSVSQGYSNDDKVASRDEVIKALVGKRVIITEKMDGESSTIYPDGFTHARSVDSRHHDSRTLIKGIAASIGYQLNEGMRVCGENLFAKHSIEYHALPAYFLIYNIWQDDTCLDWDKTVDWATRLGLLAVPVIFDGIWETEEKAVSLWENYIATLPPNQESEGFVVRIADAFERKDFKDCVFKYVRSNHVQSSDHWMSSEMVVNSLSK